MTGDVADDAVLRVERGRALFAFRLLAAYNFLLVIVFAAVGQPAAGLPTFFGGVASFTGALAWFVERAGGPREDKERD